MIGRKKICAEQRIYLILVTLAFLLVFTWAMIGKMQAGPDEGMRYDVARYIYLHSGKLPKGSAKSIRNARWGISYAFYPILSYMVSALYMWAASFFSTAPEVLLRAARMADVTFITVAAALVISSSRYLFKEKDERLLFSVLVIFLPEFLFVGAYVNVDSLALMAAAMILHAWSMAVKQGWTWRVSIYMAAGIGICFLSYYNAYGWILWSVFFFISTMLLCEQAQMKTRIIRMLGRGMVIVLIASVVAGWWFVRNYRLYDGDFLGRRALAKCAERYAWSAYKPSARMTPARMNWSLKDFLLYQDPGWEHNWMISVLYSFVGAFGEYSIFMPEWVSKLYVIFLSCGSVSAFLQLFRRKQSLAGKSSKNTCVCSEKTDLRLMFFKISMAGVMFTTVILLFIYAYFNDNQAQGRYLLPGIYPLMYFVVCGYRGLLQRFVKSEKVRHYFYISVSLLWVVSMVLTFVMLILPAYLN